MFSSQIHAEYCREDDEYLAHRVSQAFNMSQFIRFTLGHADAIFLCGDMNLEPVDVGYKIICANTGLKDSWIHKVLETFDLLLRRVVYLRI